MTERARLILKKDQSFTLDLATMNRGYTIKTREWTSIYYPVSDGLQKWRHWNRKHPNKEIPRDEQWVEPFRKGDSLKFKTGEG